MILLLLPLAARAQSSSSSFSIDPNSNLFSSQHTASSTTYSLQGAVDQWINSSRPSSTTYQVESGASVAWYCGDGFIDPGEACDGNNIPASCTGLGYQSGATTCTTDCTISTAACVPFASVSLPPGTSASGSDAEASAGLSINPSFRPTSFFTYQPVIMLHGTKSESTTTIYINESSANIEFPQPTYWRGPAFLKVGKNKITILARSAKGDAKTEMEIERREKGDTDGDSRVNDYDLSRLIRSWGKNDFKADFNDDGVVDEYDFSILVSRWTK